MEADAPQPSEGAAAVEAGVAHTAELASPAPQTPNGGQLAEPDTSLDRGDEPGSAERQARKATDRQALNAADLLIDRGKIAHMERRYGDAMQHFNDAAAVFQDGRPAQLAHALDGMAEAYDRQGFEPSDNAALKRSIETWRSILQYCPRDRTPSDWAVAQCRLGTALRTYGEREGSTTLLNEAVAAFRAALEEWPRNRAPGDWAATQHELGIAWARIGVREGSTVDLTKAVAAFRAALEEWTRDRAPSDWARAQYNLGNVLARLGERENGTAHLTEAVAAYQAALQERTQERAPVDWAMTVGNQGVALMLLAERASDPNRARVAVQQIETGFMMMQEIGYPALAADYNRRLSKARTILEDLTKALT